jgi:hypothetical protein
MGIALSMISGGDVALIWDSYLADGGEKSRGAAVLGNATFASQMGTTTSVEVYLVEAAHQFDVHSPDCDMVKLQQP